MDSYEENGFFIYIYILLFIKFIIIYYYYFLLFIKLAIHRTLDIRTFGTVFGYRQHSSCYEWRYVASINFYSNY